MSDKLKKSGKIPELDKLEKSNLEDFFAEDTERVIDAKFKPRARLLLQLGDQLIKNESIALVELVKNSYDADANRVEIYMEQVDDSKKGVIVVADNGIGMDLQTVVDVWLEPGSDSKSRLFIRRKRSPKFKRLPIGEKGIGRFGAHKLGNEIEMSTKRAGANEVFVKINWKDFEKHRYLEDVPIEIIERKTPLVFLNGKTGTNITISKLRGSWDRGTAREVKRSITSLVSPFESIDNFVADFEIIDKPGWFEGLLDWEDVKDYALFNFKVLIRGNSIQELKYEFTPWASMSKLRKREVSYSKPNNEKERSHLTGEEKLLDTLSLLEYDNIPFSLNKHRIGDIVFEGYIFDRDAFVLRMGISDKTGFKKYLDSNSGIRVFRDGLRVYDYGEPENDWLDLNLRRVNQPVKKISKNIILGAIYLDRGKSSDLVEKTNREGFIDNDAYKAFKRACMYALERVEDLRYPDKSRLRNAYGPTPKSEPVLHVIDELKIYVDKRVKEDEVRREISKYLAKIETDYKRVNENLLKAAGVGLRVSVVIHEVEKIIIEVQRVIKKENVSNRVVDLVKHLSSLIDGYSEIISKSNRIKQDIKKVIEQALFNTEYRLAAHNINVVKDYETYHGNPNVEVAKNLLVGSLMNVFDNSIYWLEKEFLRNKTLEKKIFIGLREEKHFLYIIIADNGPGFLLPTDEIIEPFVSSKPGGIGLGLHIASEIMLAQEGNLKFPEPGDFEIPKEFKEGAILAFGLKKQG